MSLFSEFWTLSFANTHRRRNPIKQNRITKRYRSGSACVFVLAIGLCGFGFQLGNLLAHLRNLPLQRFLGHKERTQQVPTQREKTAIDSNRRISKLCGSAFVTMMQSADFPDLNDPSSL